MTIPYIYNHGVQQPAISIDLETGSLRPDAPIVSIGATRFYPDGRTLGFEDAAHFPYSHFHEHCRLPGQPHFDNDTLVWWVSTGDDVTLRRAAYGGEPLEEVLEKLAVWVATPVVQVGVEHHRVSPYPESPEIWVRGNMDWTWLEQAFKRCKLPTPFHYAMVREQRTLSKFAQERGVEMPERWSIEHNALNDAKYQAECVQAVYKAFPINKE
jgi:hypothetical protein